MPSFHGIQAQTKWSKRPIRDLTLSFLGASGSSSRSGIPACESANDAPLAAALPAVTSLGRAFQAWSALRGGVDNLTNQLNPTAVNNVAGAPQFL